MQESSTDKHSKSFIAPTPYIKSNVSTVEDRLKFFKRAKRIHGVFNMATPFLLMVGLTAMFAASTVVVNNFIFTAGFLALDALLYYCAIRLTTHDKNFAKKAAKLRVEDHINHWNLLVPAIVMGYFGQSIPVVQEHMIVFGYLLAQLDNAAHHAIYRKDYEKESDKLFDDEINKCKASLTAL